MTHISKGYTGESDDDRVVQEYLSQYHPEMSTRVRLLNFCLKYLSVFR